MPSRRPSRAARKTKSGAGETGSASGTPFPWSCSDDPVYYRYMTEQWGIPVRDDRLLFEMLVLEVFQAGLSWSTILHRREGFRVAFRGFDPRRIARWGDREVERLVADRRIIRNRLKIRATIGNARAFLAVQAEFGSFARYAWDFVGGQPVKPRRTYRSWSDLPAQTPLSRRFSRDLIQRGFRFLGPVAAYAFLQAVGMVDDFVGPRPRRPGRPARKGT